MGLTTADIEVYSDHETVRLIGIPFTFNPGDRTIYTGADNSSAMVLRAGWLGLKTEPFKGWQSAHFLSVIGSNGDDRVFEVKRNFNNPVQDGDWLWFPAMPQKVEPFRN